MVSCVQEKKPYTPFPPPQQPRKIDLLLESGEYFEDQKTKRQKAKAALLERREQKEAEKQKRRQSAYMPPEVCQSQLHALALLAPFSPRQLSLCVHARVSVSTVCGAERQCARLLVISFSACLGTWMRI